MINNNEIIIDRVLTGTINSGGEQNNNRRSGTAQWIRGSATANNPWFLHLDQSTAGKWYKYTLVQIHKYANTSTNEVQMCQIQLHKNSTNIGDFFTSTNQQPVATNKTHQSPGIRMPGNNIRFLRLPKKESCFDKTAQIYPSSSQACRHLTLLCRSC